MTAPSADALDAFGSALFDAYPDAVLLVEARGRIVRANSAAATLFGATVDELLQRSLAIQARLDQQVREAAKDSSTAEADSEDGDGD